LLFHQGGAVGINDGQADTQAEIQTDVFDAGALAIKTIGGLGAAAQGLTALESALDWRMALTDAWRTTLWVPANEPGNMHAGAGGVDFRARLRGTLGADAKIESLKMRLRLSDRRAVKRLETRRAASINA
jgi:hypothetical protein